MLNDPISDTDGTRQESGENRPMMCDVHDDTDTGADTEDDVDQEWFAEEDESSPTPAKSSAPPWRILIVDDDQQVHAVTRLVLADMSYHGRSVEFLSVYSGLEARAALVEYTDIAVVFLDVVMETDDAGLRLAHYIRQDLGNLAIRIILRTGQPGQAPERQVIEQYEINDYKAKGELTADKLYTAAATALRSYRHITALESSRRGLEKIIDASASLFEARSMGQFIEGVVLQLRSLIPGARGLLLCTSSTRSRRNPTAPLSFQVVAGAGAFEGYQGRAIEEALSVDICQEILDAHRTQYNLFLEDRCVIICRSREYAASAVYLAGHPPLEPIDRQLLEIFCNKVAIGLDNVYLHEQLLATQRATVHALGKLAEYKDEVTGDHVQRVGRIARRIAERMRVLGFYSETLTDDYIERIELAAMLHDVGKVAIPDAILQKPGPLDPDQRANMQRHAAVGGSILTEAAGLVDRPTYLSMGAEIAQGHHERFDGQGYPAGLSGQDIPLAGRITAVADIYDALIHERQYKPAWPKEKAINLIREEEGRHFDPKVVEAFLSLVGED